MRAAHESGASGRHLGKVDEPEAARAACDDDDLQSTTCEWSVASVRNRSTK